MGAPSELNIKETVLISVEHIKQRFTWDCGISCVMMVLKGNLREHFLDTFDTICIEEAFGESTWTIDLAYLLKRFGVKHRYHTLCFGVDPGLSSEAFYRNVLNKDIERVINRFKTSAFNGVIAEESSVTILDILSHLSEGGPVIVLVNANLLICDSCLQNGNALRACISCIPSPPYQGHYIVLVGYNQSLGKIFYRNPGLKDRICSFSFAAFDKARKSFGTDEDIIFIYDEDNSTEVL